MQIWSVDENYIPTLGMKMLDGRNFSPQFPTDSMGIVINEAAAKFLNTKETLNKKLYSISDFKTKKTNEFHIIGIVKNFNFSSLHDLITPLALRFGKSNDNISVRVDASQYSFCYFGNQNKMENAGCQSALRLWIYGRAVQ